MIFDVVDSKVCYVDHTMGQGYLLIAISLDHQSRNEKDYEIYIKPVTSLSKELINSALSDLQELQGVKC